MSNNILGLAGAVGIIILVAAGLNIGGLEHRRSFFWSVLIVTNVVNWLVVKRKSTLLLLGLIAAAVITELCGIKIRLTEVEAIGVCVGFLFAMIGLEWYEQRKKSKISEQRIQ